MGAQGEAKLKQSDILVLVILNPKEIKRGITCALERIKSEFSATVQVQVNEFLFSTRLRRPRMIC